MSRPITSGAGAAAPARSMSSRILEGLVALKHGYHAVKPARLTFVFTLAVPCAFGFNEQAKEVLRCLAEGQANGMSGAVQSSLFLFALATLCLHSWYFTRVLLCLKYPGSPEGLDSKEETAELKAMRFAVAYVPRVLGLIPALGVGVAFVSASQAYGEGGERTVLRVYGFLCWLIGLVIALFIVARQYWFRRRERPRELLREAGSAGEQRPGTREFLRQYASEKELPKPTRWIVRGMASASVTLFVVLWAWPVGASQWIGSGALLLFAAASWICYGSWLIHHAHRTQLPLVMLSVGAVVVFSLWNDNHAVRTLPPAQAGREPAWDVEEAFHDWYGKLEKRFSNEATHPVFIVTAEGGGIRAAYWTANVLGMLQDSNQYFSSHVFAISGVSGGSLGAVVFNALLKDGETNNVAKSAQGMLGGDFLSPTLAWMLYPDMVQRFLPVSIAAWDRAVALERGWEDGWRRDRRNNLFAADFMELWKGDGTTVPNLFLNGTSVESGKRIITSNLRIDETFADAMDSGELLCGPIRMSTAAHMSARFTYVSPAGRLKGGGHVVDGGYFENSGAATAADILAVVRQIAPTNADITLIVIKNSPHEEIMEEDEGLSRNVLLEALAPMKTLLHTREARGTYSETLLTSDSEIRRFVFQPKKSQVPLPLGWQLSKGAAQELQRQTREQGKEIGGITSLLPKGESR